MPDTSTAITTDVVIVGAGPAGIFCALGLSAGATAGTSRW
jgi:ribulose 1,5-bisphosphate synthetase/thiazole synthase